MSVSDQDPSMKIDVPFVDRIGSRLGGAPSDISQDSLVESADSTPLSGYAGPLEEGELQDINGHELVLDEDLISDVVDGSGNVRIVSLETGRVVVAISSAETSAEVDEVDDEQSSADELIISGEVEVIEDNADESMRTALGGLASGEVAVEGQDEHQINPESEDEARRRFEEEEAKRLKEIAQARIDRLLDIDTNLHDIHEEVEKQLRSLHVFDRQDLTLGVAGLVAGLVVDRARGYTEVGDNPLLYGKSQMPEGTIVNGIPIPEGTPLSEFVADNHLGSEAGSKYLRTLLQYGFLGDSVGREVGKILTDRYTANHKMLTKFKKIDPEALFENLTSNESWAILKQAFVNRARDCSYRSHADFFSNIEVIESESGPRIVHDMANDFLGLTQVCGFEWGSDCQTVNKGSGEAAYILVPINEPSPLSDAEVEKFKREGRQDRLKPSTDRSYQVERDSIDRIVELAGGTNGSIANIGGYDRSSFMAIINASKNPAMTSAEFSGGYLLACYDPSTPIYNVGHEDSGSTPVVYDADDYYFPGSDSATKGTGHIKWATRTWQLTDKGHSLVQTAVQDAKNNPEALIMPFLDPRPLIRESYIEVAHKAVKRAVAKTILQHKRREQIAAFDDAAADIDAGYNPKDIDAVTMPQLDESGQRSSWLPPSPAHRLSGSLPASSRSIAELISETEKLESQNNQNAEDITDDKPISFS